MISSVASTLAAIGAERSSRPSTSTKVSSVISASIAALSQASRKEARPASAVKRSGGGPGHEAGAAAERRLLDGGDRRLQVGQQRLAVMAGLLHLREILDDDPCLSSPTTS